MCKTNETNHLTSALNESVKGICPPLNIKIPPPNNVKQPMEKQNSNSNNTINNNDNTESKSEIKTN